MDRIVRSAKQGSEDTRDLALGSETLDATITIGFSRTISTSVYSAAGQIQGTEKLDETLNPPLNQRLLLLECSIELLRSFRRDATPARGLLEQRDVL